MKQETQCKIWYAIKQRHGDIVFGGKHPTIPDRIEWGGMSYCFLLKEDAILKEYPVKKKKGEDYWDAVDRLEMQFLREFCALNESDGMIESEGILAPDGTFYACEYMGHEALAVQIGALLYSRKTNASDLEARGFHRFTISAATYGTDKFTQAQINTMFDYAQKTKDKHIKETLIRYIKDNDPL